MRIPEPLFVLVNAVAKLLLNSPLHGLMSDSLTVIYYRGRKSGRQLATPVRYLRTDTGIRCTTTDHVQWWRNVEAAGEAELLVGGERGRYSAQILPRDPQATKHNLTEFLAVYPQDAVYQDIALKPDGSLNPDDLDAASHKAVMVEFQRID
jgi:deazaflavin-dependent oxidoreductase (nitroreductase family)